MAAPVEQGREALSMTIWMQKLHGMTMLPALIEVGRQYGGVIQTAEARKILIGAGIAAGNPKYVGPHIFKTLTEHTELFEHVGTGLFRLVEQEKPLSHVIALFDAIEAWLTVSDGIDYGNLDDLVLTALGGIADAYAKLTMCGACLAAVRGK